MLIENSVMHTIIGFVLGIILAIITGSLCVYILKQMAEFPLLSDLSDILAVWLNTWIPIILIIGGMFIIISLLISHFRK